MFRKIVEGRIRTAWRHLDQHDYPHVLDQLAPRFEHSFAGDLALGGTRHTREAMSRWFERLFELFPGIRFGVTEVMVRGWPWRTRAAVLIDVQADVAGEPYRNEVTQSIELRWGRITRIHNLEDTQKLERALRRLAVSGSPQAELPAIED